MTRQKFGGTEPPDIKAIRRSPKQFIDIETVGKLADYAITCELKIDRLEKEITFYKNSSMKFENEFTCTKRERDELREENDALRKDAERYRWLTFRDASKEYAICEWKDDEEDCTYYGLGMAKEVVDGLIDAAMKGQ